jgi:penicillin-binding protein 2
MAIDRRATRLGVLALVGLGLFSLLGVRLWFLQTVKADELQETITIARTRTVRIAPERGRIVDVEGRILADNERILSVGIDWDVLRKKSEREDIFTRLSGWIDVPVETMEENFDPTGRTVNPFLPYVVRTDIDEPTAIAILERAEDFPGVEILTEWKRVYPYGQHAAHVIGYMGAITEEQVDDFEAAGYLLDERVGQFGVERSLEPILHGTWGYKVIEVDAANRPVRIVEEVPAINGFDVQLTIDLEAQQYLEQTLETTLKARRGQTAENPIVKKPDGTREKMDLTQGDRVAYKAPAASGLIMDYTTGDVLAMASYPGFDNRWFEAGISGEKFAEVFPITEDPDKSILVNRAVQGRYNLGSTFKPFTAYSALSTGLLAPGDYYVDQGTYTLSNESVSSDKCVSGLVKCEYKNATCGNGLPCRYGGVNVESALAVSSDTFFYRIGEQIMLRNDNQPILQEQVRLFGFGADTGIELPFEFDGTVPDRELKRIYAERGVISEVEGERYYVGDNVQLAIGQGLLSATPLQLATGYATIANGGFVLKPSVVRQIWNPGLPDSEETGKVDFSRGTVFEDRAGPELIRQIPMPDSIRTPIVNGLRRVIYGPGVDSDFYHKTTGEWLFADYPRTNDAIPLAGKTGTAQGAGNYPWNDSSAFTAFSTDEERPWVVSAYLEKAGYGSQAAAPVVKCTFLALSGLTPMDPVDLADPLDLTSELAAQPQAMPDAFRPGGPQCWNSLYDNGVLTDEAGVD